MTPDLSLFLRSALGDTLLAASATKIVGQSSLSAYIRAVGLRHPAASLLSQLVLPTEACIGALLVLGIFTTGAAIAAAIVVLGV